MARLTGVIRIMFAMQISQWEELREAETKPRGMCRWAETGSDFRVRKQMTRGVVNPVLGASALDSPELID